MRIDKYEELLAVYHAIYEAKFTHTVLKPDRVAGSILARLANQVYDELLNTAKAQGREDDVPYLTERRIVKCDSPEFEAALTHIRALEHWRQVDHNVKRELASDLLSPFRCTDTDLEQLVTRGDAYWDNIHD